MAITGKSAVDYLKSIEDRVELYKKDRTNKFWCYKLKHGSRAEFAFDPNTKRGLYIRTDRETPPISGVIDTVSLIGKSVSTSLSRVFSGGTHKARQKVTVENEQALSDLIYAME